MSLKYRYTNQQEVPAALTSHYVEKDGSFVLNVEGAVEKSRLEELSQNNALLAASGMNCASDSTASIPNEVRKLADEKRRLEEAQHLKAGEVEKVIETRVKSVRGDSKRKSPVSRLSEMP